LNVDMTSVILTIGIARKNCIRKSRLKAPDNYSPKASLYGLAKAVVSLYSAELCILEFWGHNI